MQIRNYIIIIANLSITLLCLSFLLEHLYDLTPCPLCYIQRICLIGIICSAMIRTYRSKISKPYSMMIWSIFGLLTASRQLWIQYAHPNMPHDCLPHLVDLLQYAPLQDVIMTLFANMGGCTGDAYSWLGLSIAHWTWLGFAALFCLSSIMFRKITILLHATA